MLRLLCLLINFGIFCIQVTAQSTTQVCDGSHDCLHGGSCKRSILVFTGESVQACDCSNAIDERGTHYIGLHCENAAPNPSDISDARDDPKVCSNGGLYCLNGGKCPDVPSDPNGCSCTVDYTGVSCELEKSHDTIQKLSEGTGECTMDCENNGICQFGMLPDYLEGEMYDMNRPRKEDNAQDALFYQHCRCQEGFYGMNCEHKHETCGDKDKSGRDAVGHYCHHGSTCVDISKLEDVSLASMGGQKFTCDCSAGNAMFENVAFAGEYCETQSTSICSRGDELNGHQFCANYGTCVEEKNGIYSCECPKGYKGDHCEYSPDQSIPMPSDEKCTKTVCENGGVCRFGRKNHGSAISKIMAKSSGRNALGFLMGSSSSNENYEHCVCPPGFVGTLCEHEAEVCPNGIHVCFHGSRCLKKTDEDLDDEDEYKCSCNNDDDEYDDDDDDDNLRHRKLENNNLESRKLQNANLEGKYCQIEINAICEDDRSCMNGGKCNSDFNRCQCKSGFRGSFCEYGTPQNSQIQMSNDKENNEVDVTLEVAMEDRQQMITKTAPVGSSHHHHGRHRQHSSKIIFFSFAIVLLATSLVVLNVTLRDKNGVDNQPADDYLMKGRSRRLSFLKEQQELHAARLQTNHYPTIPKTILETVDIAGNSNMPRIDPSIADLM